MLTEIYKICIIDDNVAVGEALKFLFNSIYDFQVSVYRNPKEFLKEFSSHWRGCLLIDCFMPFINGIDLVKELKNRGCEMTTILMSGLTNKEVATRSLAAGASAFLAKPLNISKLFETITVYLQESVTGKD